MASAGKQIDGKTLYERQKAARASRSHFPGPSIIAINMQMAVNLGSVLRIADAAGCSRVVFVETKQLDMTRVHKTARNSEALIAWETLSYDAFITQAVTFKPLIALEITTESTSIYDAQLPNDCAIVIGSERHGVPADILDLCDAAVHIPMFGVNGSMNVTHALAVALFEWRRQHAHQSSPA